MPTAGDARNGNPVTRKTKEMKTEGTPMGTMTARWTPVKPMPQGVHSSVVACDPGPDVRPACDACRGQHGELDGTRTRAKV